jgi:hypothetical protein
MKGELKAPALLYLADINSVRDQKTQGRPLKISKSKEISKELLVDPHLNSSSLFFSRHFSVEDYMYLWPWR